MRGWPAIGLLLCIGCATKEVSGDTGAYLQRGSHREVTVAWRSQTPAVGVVEWGTDPSALDRVVREEEPVRHHELVLEDLSPRTRIHYRYGAGDEMVAGDWLYYDVPAPPAEAKPIVFWVLGDSGTGDANQAAVAAAMDRQRASESPDFLLHVGDIAYESGSRKELIERHFEVYDELLGSTVVWPALGNHEARSLDAGEGPWFDFFVLPTEGEAGGEPSGSEVFYSFDHGPGHFVVLDSATASLQPDDPMLRWLERDLARTDARWTVVAIHHAPHSDGTHRSDEDERMTRVREHVVPILERHGVDLVFSGHSHGYERSALVAGERLLDESSPYDKHDGAEGGTVYVVAGHGGRRTGGRLEHPLMVAGSTAYGFVVVEMDEAEVRVRNVPADDSPGDSFVLRKAP